MATSGNTAPVGSADEDFAVGGKMPVYCETCERSQRQNMATTRCSSCDVKLCSNCCQGHRVYAPGDHVFVSLEETEDKTVSVDMKGFDMCKQHEKGFAYLCKDHDSLCCEDCLCYKHRKCDEIHKIRDLMDMTASESWLLNRPSEEIRNTLSKASDMIEKCDTKDNENEIVKDELLKELERHKLEVIKRLDKEKTRIEKEIEGVTEMRKPRFSRKPAKTYENLRKPLGLC